MIICPVCQTKNTDEALYCEKCCVKMSAAIEAARRIQTKDVRVPLVCPPDNMKKGEIIYKTYPKKEIRNLMIETYSRSHPERQVKKIIRNFEKVIKHSGCENMPEHFGEMVADRQILEGKYPFDLKLIYYNIDKAIAEGATRADIIEYYDMFFIQRMMIDWSEQMARETALYFFAKEGIWSEDEIVSKIKKMFPIYVDPADAKYLQGEDRTLSPILRRRVSEYWSSIGTPKMDAIIQSFSSANACVRYLIRKGLI